MSETMSSPYQEHLDRAQRQAAEALLPLVGNAELRLRDGRDAPVQVLSDLAYAVLALCFKAARREP